MIKEALPHNNIYMNPDISEISFGCTEDECKQMSAASKVMIFENKEEYMQSKELIKDCEKNLKISEHGIIETETKQIIVLFK